MRITPPSPPDVSAVQTEDGSQTAFSNRYQQTYHSHFGALTESQQVFLHGSGVADRLKLGQTTSVLEIGFGLGLNFLVTADYALAHGAPMHYVGWEHDPVEEALFRSLDYQSLLNHEHLANLVAKQLSAAGMQKFEPQSSLSLVLGDAIELASKATSANVTKASMGFDAIYLDAFSPETNPECWSLDFLTQLHSLLNPHATLASYCVKGSVQRALKQSGFRVVKRPGPPGKREILSATKQN